MQQPLSQEKIAGGCNPALRKLRREECTFKASLDYSVSARTASATECDYFHPTYLHTHSTPKKHLMGVVMYACRPACRKRTVNVRLF